MNEFFCKIFVDTDAQIEFLHQVITEVVNGKAESRYNIQNEIIDLSLVRNEDFNSVRRLEFPEGFLYSRFYLEVEPNGKIDSPRYIRSVSLLLENLWIKGFKAVAACDFEDLLPRKVGSNYVGD